MPIYDFLGNIIATGGEEQENTKKYVVLGDSIPAFGASTGGTGTIVDYLKSYVGGDWYNLAVGGTTMSAYRLSNQTYDCFTLDEWADSISSGNFSVQRTGMNNGVTHGGASISSIIETADQLNWLDVDTVLIAFGTNDLVYNVSQIGTATDTASKNGTMVAALKYAINKIHSKYPLIKIIVCGIIYRGTDSPGMTKINNANDAIKEACAKSGIKWVDMLSEMGVDSSNNSFFLYDGTHPSVAGKMRYATAVAKNLYKVTDDKAYTTRVTGTNVTFSPYSKSVYPGQNFTIRVNANSGYTIQTVTVKMGGVDISSSAYSSGVITIRNVSGDVEITAIAG